MDVLHRLMEARTLRVADAIVTVTQSWAAKFQALYPSLRTEVIPNGFDTRVPVPPRASGLFRLVYTGKIDPAHQPLHILLAGLASAVDTINSDRVCLTFHCYGTAQGPIQREVARFGLERIFEWAGPLSHAASQEAQLAATVLVVFGWSQDTGWIPAKLFDYLGSGRRILYVGGRDSEPASILEACGRGETVDSPESCRKVLVSLYREWRETHVVLPGGDAAAVERYAFRHRVDEFDRLLSELRVGPSQT